MTESIRAKLVNVSCEKIYNGANQLVMNVDELRCRSVSKMNSLHGAHFIMKTLHNFLVSSSLVTQLP